MKFSKILAAAALFLCLAEGAMAVPAYPGTFKIKQADGTEVTVRIKGDEKGNCLVTEDGYA